MFSGKILAAIAASSMIVAPAMAASANPAASLSITSAVGSRAGSHMKSASDARGKRGGSGTIIALVLVAGIIAILVIAATKNDNSRPTSR